MKGWIKSLTSDKYLTPIREQMIDMLDPGARVIDLGCGSGDFLIKAHSKIESGFGVDGSKSLVKYAQNRTKDLNIANLTFEHRMIHQHFKPKEYFTHATASLFFHVLPQELAAQILKSTATYSDRLIICAFAPPENKKQRFLMWFDQRFTSHYRHYIEYCQNGYMEGLIKKCQLTIKSITDTFDPTMKIYSIKL
ncbi:Methyltransferase domain-containing protein [Ekhidna lutea]|uniref:Methyltransferase domain-containing protein n=1 Tax=Ekhidna lutea TaxID=447679 RepID=A0A239HU04_EKHLU|nr:methyltransferase domain-containing protein [Ekhidna lutea]SNS84751.1 Methyltransferase domain-containing protein [Ekhidna lutea]